MVIVGVAATPESSIPATVESGGGGTAGFRANSLEEESEEIQVLPTAVENKPIEEITISDSDDEDESEKNNDGLGNKAQRDTHDPDGLEIIQELPYSYMNRSRGPKPDFLRSLLQQNNRKIEKGGKITDLTTMEPYMANIPLPVRKIQEVTLSSDEEMNETFPPDETDNEKSQPSAEISPTYRLNVTSNGQPSDAAEVQDKEATKIPRQGLEQVPGTSASFSGSVATKRSHSQLSLPTSASTAKKSSGNKRTRPRSGSPKKNGDEIALQMLLTEKAKEMQVLGEEEVDLDDEENSSFLLRDRLSKKCYNSYKALCNFKKYSTKSGRAIERRIKLSENLTEFPEIGKAVEDFVNSGQRDVAPAFFQVKEVVESAAIQHNQSLDAQQINSTAERLFKEVMKKIRDKRVVDSVQNGYPDDACGSVLLGKGPPDPALESPELAAKLEENDRLRLKSEQEIAEKFVEKERELRRTHPEALEEGCDSLGEESDEENLADDDEEEDVEMVNGEAEKTEDSEATATVNADVENSSCADATSK